MGVEGSCARRSSWTSGVRSFPRHAFSFSLCAWEVADSLYRRGDEVIVDNPRMALDAWHNYNRTVLDFCRRFPQAAC